MASCVSTKIAKREEGAGNPLGFLEKPLNGYTMNYIRCCAFVILFNLFSIWSLFAKLGA